MEPKDLTKGDKALLELLAELVADETALLALAINFGIPFNALHLLAQNFKRATAEDGDADEARNLVQTAAAAVALVQLLYQRKPRVLADVAKDRMDFPIMGSFAKGPMRSQMEMLKKLGLGDRSPIRTTGIKQDLFYDAVFALLKPLFDAIRRSMLIPSQINPEEYSDFPPAVLGVLPKIKALPELDPNSKESARRWIEALVDYWFAALPAGTDRQSGMLGQAMESRRSLERRQRKARGRLIVKYGKNDADLDCVKATKASGENEGN